MSNDEEFRTQVLGMLSVATTEARASRENANECALALAEVMQGHRQMRQAIQIHLTMLQVLLPEDDARLQFHLERMYDAVRTDGSKVEPDTAR